MDRPLKEIDFRRLFESVPDPCLVLDPDLWVVAVNEAYLKATMTTRDGLLGHYMFEAFPDNPGDPNATGVRNLQASLHRVLKTKSQDVMAVQRYDIARPAPEGGGFEERYWSPINTPVLGSDGTISFIVHRVQDVTEFVRRQTREAEGCARRREAGEHVEAENYQHAREVAEINLKLKQANDELETQYGELRELNTRLEQEAAARMRAQEDLRQANAELERSNRSLELFASVASHDLQEPLHTITSYTELLARRYRDKLDDRALQYVDFIVDGTNHMHRMINDLLAYSRVSTRAKPFAPVDLDVALDQALGSLRTAIEESRAAVQRADLPTVDADDLQLAQLFQNLVSNALKFARQEVPPAIRITCEPSGNEWIVGVHDNGIGIEPRFFDQIFEIFRRLHTRREYEGTGIGLAICKRIVEHHGGRIWVESSPGHGTSFYFALPMRGTGHDK